MELNLPILSVDTITRPAPSIHVDDALCEIGRRLRAENYEFTTVTPETHRRILQRAFDPASATLRDIFGWNRPFHVEQFDAELQRLLRAADVIESPAAVTRCTVRFSTCGPRLVVHSGYPTIENDAVFFGPDTYRFIGLLERTLARCGASPERIVDIGAGTGLAAIHLSHRFPGAEVVATDINRVALLYCAVNAALNHASIEACYSDILHGVSGLFDLIVANPPYLLDSRQRQYRHGGGKTGEGLALRIVREGAARLSRSGKLILYTGVAMDSGADRFRNAVEEALAPTPWMIHDYHEIDPDVFGEELDTAPYRACDRIAVVGVVVAAR